MKIGHIPRSFVFYSFNSSNLKNILNTALDIIKIDGSRRSSPVGFPVKPHGQTCQVFHFYRKPLAIPWEENSFQFVELKIGILSRKIETGCLQQAGNQRCPQDRKVFC